MIPGLTRFLGSLAKNAYSEKEVTYNLRRPYEHVQDVFAVPVEAAAPFARARRNEAVVDYAAELRWRVLRRDREEEGLV